MNEVLTAIETATNNQSIACEIEHPKQGYMTSFPYVFITPNEERMQYTGISKRDKIVSAKLLFVDMFVTGEKLTDFIAKVETYISTLIIDTAVKSILLYNEHSIRYATEETETGVIRTAEINIYGLKRR